MHVFVMLHVHFMSTGPMGGDRQQVHRHACELLANTGISEVLNRVGEEKHLEDQYRRYLKDYIRSVHKVTHKHSRKEHMVRCM